MRDKSVETLTGWMNWTHNSIADTVANLDESVLCLSLAPTAPPIGWHVWHISRWADWLQASFPEHEQIWESEDMTSTFKLDVKLLGPMQTGLTMPLHYATKIPQQIGKAPLFDYMNRVFAATENVLNNIELDDLFKPRESFAKWENVDGKIIRAKGKEVTLYYDIMYHFGHAGRHLGMIEALIGAILRRNGTATL